MENHFSCPHCGGQLRVGDSIILVARNNRKEKGLMLFHPEIGNYRSVKHPEFSYSEGERVDFLCPVCQHTLDCDVDENLVYLHMKDEQGREYDIYFSRIAGEKSTFQVEGDTVKATGEHSSRYTYFKLSEKFRKYLKS